MSSQIEAFSRAVGELDLALDFEKLVKLMIEHIRNSEDPGEEMVELWRFFKSLGSRQTEYSVFTEFFPFPPRLRVWVDDWIRNKASYFVSIDREGFAHVKIEKVLG